MQEEYSLYLPSYRSLLSPSFKYDYRLHLTIQLTQLDIKNIIAKFKLAQSQPKALLNTKYRSLLSDVTFQAQRISKKVLSLAMSSHDSASSARNPSNGFCLLPHEIQIIIFTYLNDFDLYRSCLYVCKHFYLLSKPFLLSNVALDSTYRFAQFVTMLRLNVALGQHVISLDLSGLKPGNHNISSLDELLMCDSEEEAYSQISAGWRDWKFKNNIYALHPAPAAPLKSLTPAPVVDHRKRVKISKYFKLRKSQIPENSTQTQMVRLHRAPPSTSSTEFQHPKTNKFLISYASSKDVPIGYILHVINLCPNLQSLNLANISLSSDYRVSSLVRNKYHSYDLMINYGKNIMEVLNRIKPTICVHEANGNIKSSIMELASSKSSVFSMNTFSKPIWKYNSLLPPMNIPNKDLIDSGDGELFLSDLHLKSINTNHLQFVLNKEILLALQKKLEALTVLNLSSIIWIDLKMVRHFLFEIFSSGLQKRMVEGKTYELYRRPGVSEASYKRHESFQLDLRDSGMQRSLPWAKNIDAKTKAGEILINRIINDELLSDFEENYITEQHRRGRAGENYFA